LAVCRLGRHFCIGSVVAGESGGTSRWSHGLCYLFSALRRDGLIPDKLSLNLPTLLRSLNLFLKLGVWTVPHSLTTYQPRHGGKQDKHGPELSRFHSSTSVHGQAPHEVLRLTLARLTNCAPPATTKRESVDPAAAARPDWAKQDDNATVRTQVAVVCGAGGEAQRQHRPLVWFDEKPLPVRWQGRRGLFTFPRTGRF
jgi:hypothetical protein